MTWPILGTSYGLPRWLSGEVSTSQGRRCRFDPWIGKIPLKKDMATYSSILAWSVPWIEKPGGLQSRSDQISHSVVSDSLQPHELQHTRPPCPSPTPRVHPDSLSIESVMPSSHLILCRPLLLLPPIPPSIRVFSDESALHMRWPKYWSFSFSIIPSKEIPGLISFRMEWLDLLAVQGTLKNLLQHHSSKASILRHSAFFTVQLSHPYMTTGKTIALTRRTFVGKVMSLLLNMLSRLVITFLPRSKLQSKGSQKAGHDWACMWASGVQVSVQVIAFNPLELLDYVIILSNFWELLHSSTVAAPCSISTSGAQGFQFPSILTNTCRPPCFWW